MNINKELLQIYVNHNLLQRKDIPEILAGCERSGVGVRDYLLARDAFTETAELPALAEYFCMPYVEIDMLEFDIDYAVYRCFRRYGKHNKLMEAVTRSYADNLSS